MTGMRCGRCAGKLGSHPFMGPCSEHGCGCREFTWPPAPVKTAKAKPVGVRVEAEWFVEDQAEAEQLAESLMLMGAETSSSSPAENSCAGHGCDEMHTFVPGRCAAAATT